MLHLFIVQLNGTYIGTMIESAAVLIAPQLCEKVGDVITITTMKDVWDPAFIKHTYYRNSTEVISFTYTDLYIDRDYDIEWKGRMRVSTYSKRLTALKYDMSVPVSCGHKKPETVSHLKRDINRAARRVGKKIIQEQFFS